MSTTRISTTADTFAQLLASDAETPHKGRTAGDFGLDGDTEVVVFADGTAQAYLADIGQVVQIAVGPEVARAYAALVLTEATSDQVEAFETERDEEATRTLVETTAWACAEEQVRQGATSWDPQGVIYQGDVDALTNALGREPNEDELEYFREVFVGAIESEAKAAASALSSTAAWETYVGNQPVAEWLANGGTDDEADLEEYLAKVWPRDTTEATRPIIARKLAAYIARA